MNIFDLDIRLFEKNLNAIKKKFENDALILECRLLKKDSIYLTEDFIPYESMVRDNIKQNILKLKNLY